jgi:hypothetical protein
VTEPLESPIPVVTDPAPAPATTSAFMPVLILGLVMLAWFIFQAFQMRSERAMLQEVLTNQERQMQEAKKVREAFDALVRGTAELAGSGNPSAQLIVNDLKSHGVPIPAARPPTGADDRTSR